jgi:hypothetical protein
MRPWAHLATLFSGAAVLVAIVMAPISVYVFGQYERAWGMGASTQVLWWVSIGWGVAALFTSAIGAAAARRPGRVPALLAILAGAAFLPVSLFVMTALDRSNLVVLPPVGIGWMLIGPAIICFCLARWCSASTSGV